MTVSLVVSVDTEEEGLWSDSFNSRHNTTENLNGLPRFQETCEALGVVPTYLIDAPVLQNNLAISRLKQWWSEARCEVGAHCHAWCNPPFANEKTEAKSSYLCNLPPDLQEQKLEWLTTQIQNTFDRTPLSYRAGRYGFDELSARILGKLGYTVDSSVLPMHNYQMQGGPDFCLWNPAPSNFGSSCNYLTELPITAGFTCGNYLRQRARWMGLRESPWRNLRLAGLADRLGLVRRLKLSPEGTRLRDLKSLVDRCVEEGRSTLVLMLHSTSLLPGYSPYAQTPELCEKLYLRFTSIVKYIIESHHAEPMGLTEAATRHRPNFQTPSEHSSQRTGIPMKFNECSDSKA